MALQGEEAHAGLELEAAARKERMQVVSKYIGETEKNPRRVFDAAEQGGLILLFDQAFIRDRAARRGWDPERL
ncbi:hypothetical protein [Archangium sp.]|uniref:hypothetical protein n=1 Tax=Archangium sp. TaxID=1872627 RepID=UPI00286C6AD4|nr:hypothetical protein [Archangium sp.]